jgi:haloalkane dehalogenase
MFAERKHNDTRLDELGALEVPFRLIWGGPEPYLNTGVAEDLVCKLPDATLQLLAAGRWPQIDQPAAVAKATRTRLTRDASRWRRSAVGCSAGAS